MQAYFAVTVVNLVFEIQLFTKMFYWFWGQNTDTPTVATMRATNDINSPAKLITLLLTLFYQSTLKLRAEGAVKKGFLYMKCKIQGGPVKCKQFCKLSTSSKIHIPF